MSAKQQNWLMACLLNKKLVTDMYAKQQNWLIVCLLNNKTG
jgi:phosphosulfolactate phosphohydrolase-like enzyme